MDQPPEPVLQFGTITFTHKDNSVADCKFDRLAHAGSTLAVVALVAAPMQVKAIRAILHAKNGSPYIKPAGQGTKCPTSDPSGYGYGDYARIPSQLQIDEAGYETYVHRLEYGLVHAAFVTRDEKFIRFMSPDSIWHKLKSDKYSTPLIREWMPYVNEQLIEKRLLKECKCYRLNCGVLDLANDSQLDEIVSEGIKNGRIAIPQ